MRSALLDLASANGFSLAWGKPELLENIRCELAKRRADGTFAQTFLDSRYLDFRYLREVPFEARTIGVVSIPVSAYTLDLGTAEGPLEAVVPPIYFLPPGRWKPVIALLDRAMEAQGFHCSYAHLPSKSVGARLGLTHYGRNNVTYTPEAGSYHFMVGFATDADLGWSTGNGPVEPRLLSECEGCDRCLAACPTKALSADRFVMRHERCLTLWNEMPGDFPAFVAPHLHHTLMGCTRCTDVCPANKGKLRTARLGALAQDEVEAVVEWAAGGRVWPPPADRAGLVEKAAARLRGLGLVPEGDEPTWLRNLAALVIAQRISRA